MIIKGILNYIIRNKWKIYFKSNQQLLIYVKSKSGIRKSRVIKAIEIGFVLLSRRNELVIFVLTDFAANGIGGNTIYTVIEVNTWAEKNHEVKINT